MFASKSHYQILQIPTQSSIQQIKTAFKRQIRKHHPDKNILPQGLLNNNNSKTSQYGNPQKKEISMQIIEAYQCLMDPKRRKAYDQELKVQTLKFHLKQTRHKDTVSLSSQDKPQKHKHEQHRQNDKLESQTNKQFQQENTAQQEDDVTILVCQQCFGQNQIQNRHLQQLYKVQLSINCHHCGLYITIME